MASQEFITHKPSKLLEPYISFYFQQKILNNEQDGNFLYKTAHLTYRLYFYRV